MRQKRVNSISFIASWPSKFSLLELLILLTGIGTGLFLYFRMEQVRVDSLNASYFNQETNELLLSISLINNNLNSLLQGAADIDVQEEVFSRLDKADALCADLDQGGPSGKFVPVTENTKLPDNQFIPVCSQLSEFRIVLSNRWQNYLNGEPDTLKKEYEHSFIQTFESIQRFEGIADPHIEEASVLTKNTNLGLSIGLTAIFCIIVFNTRHSRLILSDKTKELQKEIENSTSLNLELEKERTLLNTLLDALPDAVFAKDMNKKFIITNHASAGVMGEKEKESLIGKSEADFQPPTISEEILALDEKILSTGVSSVNQEEKLIDVKTGISKWRMTTKVPILDNKGKITGLVGISRDITQQKETEEALRKVNEQLTSGIAALEQNAHETERLSEMVDLLQACPNTEEACDVIANQLSQFFPKDTGALYLLHSSRNLLELATSWGPDANNAVLFKPDDCWGLRRGKMHVVESKTMQSENDTQSLICPHLESTELNESVCVPLIAQGETLGLLHLHHKADSSTGNSPEGQSEWYNKTKRRRIHTIVDSLSLSLANLKLRSTLRQQSIRDALTSMFNRRYMEETLEREILRAERNNEPVGVIMLDIDHFKQFNDSFGHQAGDVLLQSIGRFLLSHVRGEDVACRYGGEEFILLLPGSSIEKSLQRAEEIREKVSSINVVFQGQTLGAITLSLGVAVFPEHGRSPEDLIRSSDQALYRAKTKGRNCVVVAD